MLNKFDGHVLVSLVVHGQFPRYFQHVKAEKCHPRGTVSLLEVAPGWQRRTSIEDTDVIQAKKSSLKGVLARPVFSVQPPCEIHEQLLEATLQPSEIPISRSDFFQAIS